MVKRFFRFALRPVNLKYPALILIILFLVGLSFMFFAVLFGKAILVEFLLTAMPQKKMTGINILAVGIDNTDYVQRSDTIIVVHVGEHNRIGVLSIPRDTRVKMDGIGLTKINHAYAYGKMPLLLKTTSQFLNIPIQYYVRLNITGLETLIDQLGGVNLNVEKRMYYVDHAGALSINFNKGNQHLNGKEAVSYLRYRHDAEGDIGRIKRQQNFLKTAFNRVIQSKDILKAPNIFRQLNANFESNLSIQELIGLAVQINKANRAGKVVVGTIPGEPTLVNMVSYWQPNIIETDRAVQQVLLGAEKEVVVDAHVKTADKKASQDQRRKITLDELNRVQSNLDLKESHKKVQAQKQMTLEVLNGSGNAGVAKIFSRYLKDNGFKVSFFGNAGSYDYAKTVIVDWKGNVQNTLLLANFLHIDPAQIIIYHKPDKKINATIVVGKDWNELLKTSLQKKKNGK